MFMQLKEPLREGSKVKGTLVFEKAGKIDIEYEVSRHACHEVVDTLQGYWGCTDTGSIFDRYGWMNSFHRPLRDFSIRVDSRLYFSRRDTCLRAGRDFPIWRGIRFICTLADVTLPIDGVMVSTPLFTPVVRN